MKSDRQGCTLMGMAERLERAQLGVKLDQC